MSPPVGPYIVDIVKVKAIFHGVCAILQNICSYTIKTGRRLFKKKTMHASFTEISSFGRHGSNIPSPEESTTVLLPQMNKLLVRNFPQRDTLMRRQKIFSSEFKICEYNRRGNAYTFVNYECQ